MPQTSNHDEPLPSNNDEQTPTADDDPVDDQVDKARRYPDRHRAPPKYLDNYVTDVDDYFTDDHSSVVKSSVDFCYRMVDIPNTYQDAISSPESSNSYS